MNPSLNLRLLTIHCGSSSPATGDFINCSHFAVEWRHQ